MEEKIVEIAERIRGMRDILEISVAEMAQETGVSTEEYVEYEEGRKDFNFTFLYKVASRFNIDLTELMTGSSPRLSDFTIVRKNEGLPIERRKGFQYKSLAHKFKNRNAEVFMVLAKYDKESASAPITLNSHEGQEFDYIVEGSMKICIGTHEEYLNEGDIVYYDATIGHGMVAYKTDCKFLAVIIRDKD
jgi:transcriptional regulator with XRE-family HTH domain